MMIESGTDHENRKDIGNDKDDLERKAEREDK